jgi:hypothetical protein
MDGGRSALPMTKLRNGIDAVNNFLASQAHKEPSHVRTGRNPLHDEMTNEIVRAQAQIAPEEARITALQSEIDRIDARLDSLEEGAKTLDALRRNRENLQTALAALRQQAQQAGLFEEMDKRGIVNTQIVENPAPISVSSPAHPKQQLYVAAGLAGGILLAALVMVLILITNNTFITPEAVEASLDVPVLANFAAVRRRRAAGR